VVWFRNTLPITISLVLAAVPAVRAWWRRHLTPTSWSWQTGAALYVVSFIGSAFGILPLWAIGMITDPFPAAVWRDVTLVIYAERTFFPLLATLLGLALWPALRRGPFSVANQLRYGLPVCILLTFFFAGRLFVEQAYDNARTETTRQLRHESQAAARAVDAELDRAATRLRTWASTTGSTAPPARFLWAERVPAGPPPATLPPAAHALLDSARVTGRVQRGFVPLPDTTAHTVALAVPSRAAPSTVVVGGLAPRVLRQTLAIWEPSPSGLYLVTRENAPVVGPAPPTNDAGRSPLLEALRRTPGATAQAQRGRYEHSVLGALTALPGLPGAIVVERGREDAYFHVFEMLASMALIILLAGGGALAVGFFLSRRVVDPLDRLIDAARRVGGGDLSTRVAVEQKNELGELARSFNSMIRDLSASVRRLRANEERLRLALDAAQMGTWNWTVDANADVLSWSPQTYVLLGVPATRTDTLPQAYLARVHPQDRAQVVRMIAVILQTETDFEFEHRIRPERGEERWVKVKGRVARDDGRPQRMSGVVMDVTARKKAERELVAAKEEAEEMSRLKSAFLANVSHEIRTPLTSIIGFAEILAEEASDQQRKIAEKVVASGRRLKTTLDSVLDLSMIEAGEFSLECRTVDFTKAVRRRTDLLRPMAERKGLSFTVDTPDGGPEVYLDPNGLDRILTNLITNAIKFTEEGEVAVRVRANAAHVDLQVCDSGIGIDEDFLPELFEAFKQESEGLQREHEGTGLGLSITKELVDLMEGEIEVDSTKGEGTTFTVRLPYEVKNGQ
jgi:PAS domain S-box-containing protein